MLIQHEFKYTKSSHHIEIYWDHKLLGVCFRHRGDLAKSIEHLELAMAIATTLFINLKANEDSLS